MQSRLDEVPDLHVYFSTLVVRGNVTLEDHRTIRRKFCEKLKRLRKELPGDIEFRAVAEMGEVNSAIHYHACFISSVLLTKAIVRQLWQSACGDREVIVEFDQTRHTRKAAVKYMFKVEQENCFLKMFQRRTLALTWQSRKFFGVSAGRFEKHVIAKWRKTLPPPSPSRFAAMFADDYSDDDASAIDAETVPALAAAIAQQNPTIVSSCITGASIFPAPGLTRLSSAPPIRAQQNLNAKMYCPKL